MVARNRRIDAMVEGWREAIALAATLGGTVRLARRARRMSLSELGHKVGLSATRIAEIERGEGVGSPLQVWVALGIALGRPLAVALTRPLGEPHTDTRDAGHLEIQEHLLTLARAIGRRGTFELPTRPTDPSRSTDVGICDPTRRLRILAECWNTFGDLGAAARTTTRKAAEPHLDAAFPGSSRAWVAALTTGAQAPTEPGIVWFDAATGRLTERRRSTI